MMYYEQGSQKAALSEKDIREGLYSTFQQIGERKKVLAIPPDFTRFHSGAGLITRLTYRYYGHSLTDILPAIGTHAPMTQKQISKMYGDLPQDLFRVHDWRNEIVTLGEVPAHFVQRVSEGKVDYSWPAQVNERLVNGHHDLILSIGQIGRAHV